MSSQILIVEDDSGIRPALINALEAEGYQVTAVANGQEALENLRENRKLPNVILLDLKMPIMDGYEFMLQQSKDEKISSIPIVIISADSHNSPKMDFLRYARYLHKPIHLDELLDAVQTCCALPTAWSFDL